MNQKKYDILNYLNKDASISLETLSIIMDDSQKKIEKYINECIEEGYINEDLSLTDKATLEISRKKPQNAIIVADDLGIGALTVDKDTPDGLLELNGEVVIERLIQQLQEVGITDITVVVGFLGEKYDYLKEKYNVTLTYNKDYALKGSLHTIRLVDDKLGNTYILPANIWAEKNPFSETELYSWYAISDTMDDSSTIRYKPQHGLMEVDEDKGGNTIVGISYLATEDADVLKEKIGKLSARKSNKEEKWEKALFDKKGRMMVFPRVYSSTQVFSMSNIEQLSELANDTNQLDAEIIELISEELAVEPEEIMDIFVLESGKTNRSFRFVAKDKQYIMRIPGEGTGELINREHEYMVYKLLKGRKISDRVVYMSPENGYKISEFIEGARSCDPHDRSDVIACMAKLREFHDNKLEVDHVFDMFGKIDYYEELRGETPSKYEDYEETKEKIKELENMIADFPKEWILSHGDSVPGNFLFADEEVYLIDWEYAGMQDPHIDIAMFALSAMYSREELDQLLADYFVEGYTQEIKYKIYAYMAVGGLLWSNWSEYKEVFGVEFGEYSLRQYEYAKEYYDIIQEEFVK